MNNHTRDRAARIIIGALASSELSAKELLEIAKAFADDKEFQRRLGELCAGVSELVHEHSDATFNKKRSPLPNDEIRNALLVIRRKRITKRDLIEGVTDFAPLLGGSGSLDERMFVSDIVNAIYENGDKSWSDFERWLETFAKAPSGDPYVEGILKNR